MENHKKQVVKAFVEAPSEYVRSKYRWLMEYQNRTLEGYPNSFDGARFLDSERMSSAR